MKGNTTSLAKKILYTFTGLIIIGGGLILLSRLIVPQLEISDVLSRRYNLESKPVSAATGNAWNYSIAFPPGTWFIRDQRSAVQDSPDADLWVTNPKNDAHVIVSGAEIDESQITMDIYRDSVLENYDSGNYDYSIIDEYSLSVKNGDGYYMELSINVEDNTVLYYYGLYIKDNLVIQMLCFMNSKEDESDAETFRQIIKSFRFTD